MPVLVSYKENGQIDPLISDPLIAGQHWKEPPGNGWWWKSSDDGNPLTFYKFWKTNPCPVICNSDQDYLLKPLEA